VTSGGAAITGFAGPVTVLVTGAGSIWTVGGGGLSIGPGALEATSVTLADGGALVLTSGDLQIAELGTLNIGNGARAGTLTIAAGAILLDGRIVADFTDSATIANDILANATPGSLTKRGSGVLTLTGTNSYTGGTVLEGGTLSVSSEANLGDVSGALTLNGGVLQVTGTSFTQSARPIIFGTAGGGFDIADAANTFTVTQSFSGPGSLSKLGAGTLLLTGAQSYSGATIVAGGSLLAGTVGAFSPNSAFSVSAGATLALNGFNQTIGSLAGAGAVALGSATLTTGANNASTLFSGAINGTGGLVKTGTGALTLTGTSSFTGPTSLQSGLLTVNGSIAGSVVTINGGTLGGSGFVGGINALAGAVAPGNSIGTLSVAGNVVFAAGSTYQVELNAAGASDLIAATGTATLSGGQVQLLAAQGSYGLSTRYVILTAQGGVSGQFSGVTSNFAFLTPTLTYDARTVALTLARNAVTFPDAAVTRNQASAGRAAEALGTGNRVYDALLSSTLAEARIGFDALSGEAHAQAVSVAIETSHQVRDTIMNRLRAPFLSSPSGTVTGAFSADAPGRQRMAASPAPAFETRRFQLWGEAIGAQGRSDGDGNAASLDRRGGGMLFGAELDSGGGETPWRAGVAGGFTRTRFDIDQRRSDGTQDAVHAALYGGASFGAVNLRAGAAYAWNQTNLTRFVGLSGFSDVLRFDGQGATAQAFAEVGYALPLGSVAFEPFVQVAAVSVRSDSGTEQGGAAALRLNGRDQNLGFSILGLRAETQLGAMPLFARAMLGWRHAFGETTPTAVLAFAGAASPFQVYAAPVARDAMVAEVGLSWRVAGNVALGLGYNATLGNGTRDHALRGRLDVTF
jgi:outer membrane autotransporter protein